jgi:peroxiredoxin
MNYSNANENLRAGKTFRAVFAITALAIAAATLFVSTNNGNAQSERETQAASNESLSKVETKDKADRMIAAPEFALKDLSGKQVRLSDYKGKVVVVNFWATWCGPCRLEIPDFVRLREQYHDRGLEIIGISMDEDGSEDVAKSAAAFKINYPVVMGTMETVEAFGPMNAIPTTFIIDRQGRIESRHLGMLLFDEVESAIKPLL